MHAARLFPQVRFFERRLARVIFVTGAAQIFLIVKPAFIAIMGRDIDFRANDVIDVDAGRPAAAQHRDLAEGIDLLHQLGVQISAYFHRSSAELLAIQKRGRP